MHELTAAKRDADVRSSVAQRFEEDEIARLHLILIDFLADFILLPSFTRQGGAVPGEDPLDQTAAVESPRWFATAVPILCAP